MDFSHAIWNYTIMCFTCPAENMNALVWQTIAVVLLDASLNMFLYYVDTSLVSCSVLNIQTENRF